MNPASGMFGQRKRPYCWLLLHIGFWVSTLKQRGCGNSLSLCLFLPSQGLGHMPQRQWPTGHRSSMLHTSRAISSHSDSRAQTHRPECSSALGVQNALGNEAPMAEIPAQPAVLIWQWSQVPDEGSCSESMAKLITHMHTLRRKPEAKKQYPSMQQCWAPEGKVRMEWDAWTGSGGGWFLSTFCGRDWPGAPTKLSNLLTKTFFFPSNFCVMLVFSSRQPNPTLFSNTSVNLSTAIVAWHLEFYSFGILCPQLYYKFLRDRILRFILMG